MSAALEEEVKRLIVDDVTVEVFGNRMLGDNDPFTHNAWDKVEWTEDQATEAKSLLKIQFENQKVPLDKEFYNDANASTHWNAFYTSNTSKFFKDRHWLAREFPCMFEGLKDIQTKETDTKKEKEIEIKKKIEDIVIEEVNSCADDTTIQRTSINTDADIMNRFNYLEIGCGTGATVFPLLNETKQKNAFIYCCDYSEVAIELVKSNPSYDRTRCEAFVHDITSDKEIQEILPGSIDIIILIFVLSALTPTTFPKAISNIHRLLRKGGRLIFRDYARYDMTQMRFKSTRVLDENFYVRGDSTRVYFFEEEEVRALFGKGWRVERLGVERKMIVNRGRKVKMFRFWVQGEFVKI